jgi:dihydrolipoamide dehydrogenase
MEQSYDTAIIGSGPGGYVAAIRSAQLKMKTVLIEKDNLGGICLNWGCIPTKALLKSADLFSQLKNASDYGIKVGDVKYDFPEIIERSRKVADMNSKGVSYLMKNNKIDVIYGYGKIKSPGIIEVTDKNNEKRIIQSKNIIIATGGSARIISGMEFDLEKIISYKEAMSLKKQPDSMVIIGAGAIGIEFAYFYNEFGTKITLIEMMDSILPNEDKEITDLLSKVFKRKKITTYIATKVEDIKKQKNNVTVSFLHKGEKQSITSDLVLIAVGIQGNYENLGLEELDVQIKNSFIQVNEWYETSVNGIYAIGDVIGPPLLAHVASHEGIICMEKIAGIETHTLDYNNIPACTYCQPQVASIGMTEEKAKAAGYEVNIGRFPYSASGKARAVGERDGLVKLVFDKKYGELLGAHIIGADATELIAELGLAKTMESTAMEILKTIHAHPTLSEMIMEAAGNALGTAIHI